MRRGVGGSPAKVVASGGERRTSPGHGTHHATACQQHFYFFLAWTFCD